MRWGVEKRLEFIEFRLFWEGGINRADIMDQFGVSTPQASKDLNLYEDKAPGNLMYDKSAKRYSASEEFAPVFLNPESDGYLRFLGNGENAQVASESNWLSYSPEADSLPIPRRHVDPLVLRSIVSAIKHKQSIEVMYQSMSSKRLGSQPRWITPHAFGSDGFRWHVRAYCHIDCKFKDFILSRILEVLRSELASVPAEQDLFWFDSFDVTLTPNPVLSLPQRRVIESDFKMEDGKVDVSVRKALLYYFQKRLRLDLDPSSRPEEIPVVVHNRADFDLALAEAMS